MGRESIRVKMPDGSFKIVFRDKPKENDRPVNINGNKTSETKVIQEHKNEKPKNQKTVDPRYFNPLHPGHIDLFGADLIGRELVLHLITGEAITGELTGFAQYEVLVEMDGKKLILTKQGIIKIEVL